MSDTTSQPNTDSWIPEPEDGRSYTIKKLTNSEKTQLLSQHKESSKMIEEFMDLPQNPLTESKLLPSNEDNNESSETQDMPEHPFIRNWSVKTHFASSNMLPFAPDQKFDINTIKSPLELFQLFMSDDILNETVDNTKKYRNYEAGQNGIDPKNIKDSFPENFNKNMLLSFIGIIFALGIYDLPQTSMNWSKNEWLRSNIANYISRDKFRALWRYLHFSAPGTKRYEKIRNLIEHLNKKFSNLYSPSSSLSLDESTIKFKGRSLDKNSTQKSQTSGTCYFIVYVISMDFFRIVFFQRRV